MMIGRYFYVNEKTREMKWSPYADELANPVLNSDGQGKDTGDLESEWEKGDWVLVSV